VLLLDNLWRSREYPESVLALRSVGRLAGLEERAQQLWPLVTCSSQHNFILLRGTAFTFVRMLASELCDSVSDLAPHRVVRLLGEAAE
jgi:hypothetical protein